MTTTAEKISELQQELLIMRDDLEQFAARLQEIASTKMEEESAEKPPYPEPLECWATVHIESGKPAGIFDADPSSLGIAPDYKLIKVCEVTPQMEQDAKDAARYRWLIKHGYDTVSVLWNNIAEWNNIIDKAMENQ